MYLRDSNSEVFLPNQFAAPAATIQTLVNGAICTCLPSRERWLQAYQNDVKLSAVRKLVLNSFLICNQSLSKVNHNYRGPLRQSLILVEDDMLILKEPIGGTLSYMHLQLVPRELFNVLFVAFHNSAMGGHLNAPTLVLLARHVCLCKVNVPGVPRVCPGQSNTQQVIGAYLQLFHQGTFPGHAF
jgi:hypothetical protein